MHGQSDLGGFSAFIRLHRAWMVREAYWLCRDWHDAEDLTQMTMHKLYRRWDQLAHHEELAAYARQTLLNTFLAERRHSRWRYEISQAELPERNISDAARAVDDRVTLASAMQRLGPRQRAVVSLRFWADLSVEQTAVVLGCSPGTVTSQTHRALAMLRTVLTDDRWSDDAPI